MELVRGHVYDLDPTTEQENLLARTAGVTRLVYNLALEQRRAFNGRRLPDGRRLWFSAKGLSGELAALRRAFDWIGAVSQTAQNQALVDLDRAYANFFAGRADHPTPRKRGRNDSFRHVGREVAVRPVNRRWSEIRIPKVGWVRYRDHRPLRPRADGAVEIRNATIRRRPGGGWQVSIAVLCEIAAPPPPAAAAVGVDRGVAVPYALSTGGRTVLPDTVAKREAAIRRGQKAMARRQRGSRRYARAKARVAALKARNARSRGHVAHALSRHLARSFGLVAIEDLRVRAMTASASGSVEAPGTNVRAKSGLNRAILNVGWYDFERKLAYKLDEGGGVLVKVPAANTSRTCHACGHVDAGSRRSQAAFLCTGCGHADNADVNAAKNILARALAGTGPEVGRGNDPSLDVEGKASAPCEASTRSFTPGLDVAA